MNNTVAVLVRIESEDNSDSLYMVFKIIDEKFKKRIKDNFNIDVELELIDNKLIETNLK